MSSQSRKQGIDFITKLGCSIYMVVVDFLTYYRVSIVTPHCHARPSQNLVVI